MIIKFATRGHQHHTKRREQQQGVILTLVRDALALDVPRRVEQTDGGGEENDKLRVERQPVVANHAEEAGLEVPVSKEYRRRHASPDDAEQADN